MTAGKAVALAWVCFMAWGARGPLLAGLPATATHTLSAGCAWQPRAWAANLGAMPQPIPRPAARRAVAACYRARGLKSPIPVLKVVLAKWPSRAELAALESRQDTTEDENPLRPHVATAADELLASAAG